MRMPHSLCGLGLLVATACTEIPGEDGRGPIITVDFLDTVPRTRISSEDAEYDPSDNCGYYRERSPSQTVLISARDPGGLAELWLSTLGTAGGHITSVSPEGSPATVIGPILSQDYVATISGTPPDGEVYVTGAMTIEIEPEWYRSYAITAGALDRAGNMTETQQFGMVPAGDTRVCRGGEHLLD